MFNTKDTGPVADAVKRHWVDTKLPPGLRPFARLARWERPIGWRLLLWPCLWSLSLASNASGAAIPNLWYMILFFVGAVAMRGAGCTYNDLIDKDIDGQVERTRSRPIPSGQISSKQAKIFLGLQALTGLAVLLQFNTFSIVLGVSSLAVVAAYPFMKRITDWPQFVLGLAFSWGALMGWAVVFGSLSLAPILLYCGGIAWTIGYDTIYAHQDKEDDALVGVRSTARLFGEKTKQALYMLYGAAVVFFASAFWLAGSGPLAFAGLAVGAFHLLQQIRVLDIDDGDQCLSLFKSNSTFGLFLFAGLVLDGIAAYFLQ
ncbi:4-hydroxybenzoate octaprenyltransferase [Pseudovibrio sp. Tun.PSC04-5.I4]|uniref:4-hydroxybenzoate octaprenyltransferase n=1 Tax=Pseudovibrio sp. Tun.PSC04-5.I4 TaxID=1798213 RepID=UPI00088F5F20|nr:4-hydroxybenzoate octaprenyltransferase [Pseudovibrio sp. Tun.PSC04-5.I4]SDQ79296.1 4-hydroxybenzoate polyprenyltransferase [Pseudovibrio sp. Tun.PSC04-5.I4]